MIERLRITGHGLHTRAPVGVHDCRNLVAHRWPCVHCDQHVGARSQHLEVLVRVLGEDARRVWPEPLASLDLAVEPLFASDGSRIRQDAPVSECTRSELRSALHPADDASLGNKSGALTRDVVALLERRALRGPDRCDDLGLG